MAKDNSNDKNKITKRSSGSDSGSSRSPTDSSSGGVPLESQAPSPMCSRGCGFFGNPSFGGLCSMCYREHKSRQQPQEESDSSSSKKASGPAKSKSSSVASNTPTTPVKNVASSSGTSRPPTPYPKSSATSQVPMDLSAKSEKAKQPNSTPTKATSAKATIPESITESPEDGSTAPAATTKRKLEEVKSPAKSIQVAKCAITPTTSSPLASGTSPSTKKPRKERCATCGASIAVIAFDCRCGGRFCVKHQLASAHECNFDYRTAGQEEIAKNNPKVVADKIQKL